MAGISQKAIFRRVLSLFIICSCSPFVGWSKDGGACSDLVKAVALGPSLRVSGKVDVLLSYGGTVAGAGAGGHEDFRAGIEAFIATFIASAREAGLSRVHLIELLAKPLEGRIREIQEDASASGRSASIRSLNEVLVAVQTQLVSGEKFAEARGHFSKEFPKAVSAYLATIEDAVNGARMVVEESRKLEQVRVIQVGSEVNSTAVSPEGTLIVSASKDGVIRLFDRKTGALVRELPGHTGWVTSVSFSPDGKYVVSASDDGTVRIWEVASGQEVRRFVDSRRVWSVGFSPDGNYVLSGGGDGAVRIWDVASGKEVKKFEGHEHWVWSVGFSPDGRSVVSGSNDGTVRIWEVANGKEIQNLPGHTGWVNSVSFSPDGRFVVSASDDGTVRIWEVANGREVRRFVDSGSVWSVGFSPDGRYVVSGGGDGPVRIWEVASGREVARLGGHAKWVNSVGFSHDGLFIVSGSIDGRVRIQPISPDLYPDPARMEELARMQTKWLEDLRAHPIVFESDRPNAPQQNPVVFESKWRVWWRALLARFGGGR